MPERVSREISKGAVIAEVRPGNPWEYESGDKGDKDSSVAPSGVNARETHTCHINVVDKSGNVVALTQTLWGGFGSLVTIPKTGIVMNNGQSRFDPDPKSANRPVAGQEGALQHVSHSRRAEWSSICRGGIARW